MNFEDRSIFGEVMDNSTMIHGYILKLSRFSILA